MEIALDVQEGIRDRLSVQYFTSCYEGGGGEDWACCGGWLDWFADWYEDNGLAIPWSEEYNSHWQDGAQTCCAEYNPDGTCKTYGETSVPCEDISTSCRYPISSTTVARIETRGVGQETAIANIKNALQQNKAIWFVYYLPTGDDWDNFGDFWYNEPEDAIWDPDFSCGHVWDPDTGGGHAVLVVGYDDTDPNNSYWIVLNSWDAPDNRPNGLFRLDMDMNYDCNYFLDGQDTQSFFWQTLDVDFDITPISKGLCWLSQHQNSDGSWQNGVGITSMAALAFLNAGHTEDDPTVNKAIQYILANRHGDGSFGWGTYETSAAIWALVATHNASYNDEIADARDWLVDAQYDEGEGADPTDACYGGWRYEYSPGDGDLSNTQFALMALDAAGLPNGSATWTKAITFTSRCQNRPASNDQDWADNDTRPSYNDGGFIYYPGASLAGGTKSYGSMTAAGIWSLRLCGVGVPDGRVQAGLGWLESHEDCSFDVNPGISEGRRYQYYYYMGITKALVMCYVAELNGIDWYNSLSAKLADLQYDDGRWQNSYSGHGQEHIPEIATDFALLALQTQQPPAANLWMSIILASNADLCVYDPQGRHARLGDITIPGAEFVIEDGKQIVNLKELEAGKYRIELTGTADGGYSLTIDGYRDEEQTSSETFEGAISEAEVQKSDTLVTSMVGALTIYVEEPELLLITELLNLRLVAADPTVTSINVTSLNLSEIDETYKPEGLISQSAYMVSSTGAGSFTLKFTNIEGAGAIRVYKIDPTTTPLNQWVELDYTTTANTVTFTMSVGDPPVVFAGSTAPPPPAPPMVPAMNQWGIVTMIAVLGGLLVWRARRRRLAS